jgi:PAS domain-containing protein
LNGPRRQLRTILDTALEVTGCPSGRILVDEGEERERELVSRGAPPEPVSEPRGGAPVIKAPIRLGKRVLGWLVIDGGESDRPPPAEPAELLVHDLAAMAGLPLDRLLAVKATSRSRRRWREVLAILRASTFILDERLQVHGIAGRLNWTTKLPPATGRAETLRRLLTEESAQLFAEQLRRALDSGCEVAFEFDPHLEGDDRMLAVRMVPLASRRGQPEAVLVMTHDVTRYRDLDENRRQRLTQLRRALDRVPIGLLVLEKTDNGRSTVSIANRPLDDMLKNPLRVWLGEEGEKCLDRIQRCFRDGSWMEEIRFIRRHETAGHYVGQARLRDGTRISWQVSRIEKRRGRPAAEMWSFYRLPKASDRIASMAPDVFSRLADHLSAVVGYSEMVREQSRHSAVKADMVDSLVSAANGALKAMRDD